MKLTKLCSLLVLLCWSFFIHAQGSFQQISGSPFTTGSAPDAIAYSPVVSGNLFTAVPNFFDNAISVYLVNQTTGAFAPVSDSPFATGSGPLGLAFSPVVSGNLYAAVANRNDNTVSVYLVNQTTGAFTQVAGSPFVTGSGPTAVQFSSVVSGNLFATVTNILDNTITVYLVNQATGAFIQVVGSPFAAGSSPRIAAFSPVVSGNLFVAADNSSDNTVSVYSVNHVTGALTPVTGSPFATGAEPYYVQYSPIVSGNLFAAVTNILNNTVSIYEVNQTTGSFTQISGSPFPTGLEPIQFAFSPIFSGNLFAAVANYGDNNVSVYEMNQTTGVLTPVEGSPFATGNSPRGIAYSPVESNMLFAATANVNSDTASVFQVSPGSSSILPPPYFRGTVKKNKFLNKTDYELKAVWAPSPSSDVVSYFIYKNGRLVHLVSASSPLVFKTHIHSKHAAKEYAIAAVNSEGQESELVAIEVSHD